MTTIALQPAAVADIWHHLRQIPDPELPMLSVTDLGMIRAVNAVTTGWQVVLTPTYSGCPATTFLQAEIRQRLQQAGYEVEVVISLSPAWSSDWIAPAARQRLRDSGIAPPEGACGLAPPAQVTCPRCGSRHTEAISEFGSTACKALYRCLQCHEPFDYFKCI